MLKLSDLFSELSYGELSNLSMSSEGDGTIVSTAQPKIVNYANEGLLKLYSRFVLKEDDLLLHLHEDISYYHLLPRFAVNYTPMGEDDNEPIRYITDLPGEPFTGDIIKVLKVFDSTGARLSLNDIENPNSVFTPQTTVLQVVTPVADAILNLQYQARHAKLTGDMEELIDLPDVLFDALRSFIAYRAYSHMNTKDSSIKSQEYFTTYQGVCDNVRDGDLVSTSLYSSNVRFERRGWV